MMSLLIWCLLAFLLNMGVYYLTVALGGNPVVASIISSTVLAFFCALTSRSREMKWSQYMKSPNFWKIVFGTGTAFVILDCISYMIQ